MIVNFESPRVLSHTILGKIWILLQLIIFKNKMLFPRIILEPIGVKSNYFGEDLDAIKKLSLRIKSYFQE